MADCLFPRSHQTKAHSSHPAQDIIPPSGVSPGAPQALHLPAPASRSCCKAKPSPLHLVPALSYTPHSYGFLFPHEMAFRLFSFWLFFFGAAGKQHSHHVPFSSMPSSLTGSASGTPSWQCQAAGTSPKPPAGPDGTPGCSAGTVPSQTHRLPAAPCCA